MTARRFPRPLGLVLCLALPALLPAAAPAADAELFVYMMGGKSFGSERFTIESRGDTLELRGTMLLSSPVERQMSTRTRLVGPDERLVDYLLQSQRGDSLGLRVDPDSLRLFAYGPTYRRARALGRDDHRLQVLDNSVASHLWLLARQLQRDPAGATPISAVVPQQLWFGALTREPATAVAAKFEGKSIPVLRHRLTLAGLLTFMDTDAKGRLYALRVPLQEFEIRRPGYEAEPAAKAPAAVRKTYPTEELNVEGGGPLLPGVLTLPADAAGGPWPACLLLHGSGPMDKDMTIGPNRIFAQLAEGLADRGIATLRYDKRTFITNRGKEDRALYDANEMTLQDEVLDDALAAWRLLAADQRLDPQRLFIVGHSVGAGAAPILAHQLSDSDDADPAGLVLLAPPGRDLLTIVLEQYHYLETQGAMDSVDVQRAEHSAERLRAGEVGADDIILFAKPLYWDSVNFWKPWRDYAAQPAPALVVFGERDYQITAPDRATWATALAETPRPGAELHLMPGLNHILLHGEGTPGPSEYGMPGELETELLDLLADWIRSAPPAAN